MAVYRIECEVCGRKVTKKSKRAKYCSPACNQRAYEKRKGIETPEFISKRKPAKSTKSIAKAHNPFLDIIESTLNPLGVERVQLTAKKKKLLDKFNSVSQKTESIKNMIEGGVTIGTAYLGYKQIDDDSTGFDILLLLFGIPMAMRYASKNILPELMEPHELKRATQLDQISREIKYVDERLNEITITLSNEKAIRKMAEQAIENLNPQIERTDSYTAISADEMKKIKRTVYKLKDKWKYFLGEIEQNFKAIIHGKPKQGKSHFAIQFAQYLHTNFGDVVYFASEEGASITMENKLTRWNAKFKIVYNILGTKGIEDYIKKYQPKFVFIDSISRLQLSADNINFLVDEYIDTAWILVTQSTKHNSHKGSQELTHLADSIIQVVEGVAHQKGRTVNGETELEVFDNNGNTSK